MKLLAALALSFSLILPTPSIAQVQKPVPFAFLVFCLKNSSECKLDNSSDVVHYNFMLYNTLYAENYKVNHSIRYLHDFGDVWTVNPKPPAGDCEDYALTKRHNLIAKGIPSRSLRMAVVITENGEGHAVLVVKTSAGDFVLDNRYPYPMTRSKLKYKWIEVQSPDPSVWYDY